MSFSFHSLILYQSPVDFPTSEELYLESSKIFENGGICTCLRHLSKQFCLGADRCGAFKSKKKKVM